MRGNDRNFLTFPMRGNDATAQAHSQKNENALYVGMGQRLL